MVTSDFPLLILVSTLQALYSTRCKIQSHVLSVVFLFYTLSYFLAWIFNPVSEVLEDGDYFENQNFYTIGVVDQLFTLRKNIY